MSGLGGRKVEVGGWKARMKIRVDDHAGWCKEWVNGKGKWRRLGRSLCWCGERRDKVNKQSAVMREKIFVSGE